MAQPTSPPVPPHLWVCGRCGGPTLISKDPTHCPLDGHARDYDAGCCKNPGDAAGSGLFPGHTQHEHRHAHSCAAEHGYSMSASTLAVGHGIRDNHGSFNQVPYYTDAWDFTDSSMANSAGWQSFGSERSHPKPASDGAMSLHFVICGGAGGTAPGTWICDECGNPNGPNDVACAYCIS